MRISRTISISLLLLTFCIEAFPQHGFRAINGADPAWLQAPLDTTGMYALYGMVVARKAYKWGKLATAYTEEPAAGNFDVYGNPWWPDPAVIAAHGTKNNFQIVTLYDQSGNGRNCTGTSNSNPNSSGSTAPLINLDGQHPVVEHDGIKRFLDCSANIAAFAQNQSGVTILTARQHLTTAATARVMFFDNGATATRIAGPEVSNVTFLYDFGGRRLDADSFQRSTGLPQNILWSSEIGQMDYANARIIHRLDGTTQTTAFQTAGNTSNTASSQSYIGKNTVPAFFNGLWSIMGFYQGTVSTAQASLLGSMLATTSSPFLSVAGSQFLSWGSGALVGPYSTQAPGLVDALVSTPNGSTPTLGDLASHRFRHIARVGVNPSNGRVWECWSSSGTNEDAGGQLSVCSSSADSGATWGSLIAAVPNQDTFSGTGASNEANTVFSYPRGFVTYSGDLYFVAALDYNNGPTGTFNPTGYALLGIKCNDDGTMGSLFRISSASYTPASGFSTIAYDATLGPILFPLAVRSGGNGGSAPGNPASAWDSWSYATSGTHIFGEPQVIPLDAGGVNLVRLWRNTYYINNAADSRARHVKWAQNSTDSGATWSGIGATDIPDQNSNACGLRMADGRLLLSGNPLDASTAAPRDPLYLALFNGTTGVLSSLYYVRQGVSQVAPYPGPFNNGGAQYPGCWNDGTNIWISYNIVKQIVRLAKIPISGL